VSDPWQILRSAGLPLGMPDPDAVAPGVDELARAVELAIASEPRARAREALAAFVLAWRRQWPRTFARVFGDAAATTGAWAESAIADPNHHIKLSRIATAHLANVL
jgi:hypothetical protein